MSRPCFPEQPGVALHLVQRARGGAACFLRERDRLAYLDALREAAVRLECAVHAYVLMGNHAHLLVTPARAGSAARLMDMLLDRHGRHLAQSCGLDRSQWAEPVDASSVHARRHLLSCMRYIEENPVRARIAARPEAYRWSSFRANALGEADALVTPHAHYYALGRTPEARREAYWTLFATTSAARREG
jgi:putative transposase